MALAAHPSFLSAVLDRQTERRRLIDPSFVFQPQPDITGRSQTSSTDEGGPEAGPSKRNVVNYIEEEETVRNDLSGWYVQSGEYGSNHIFGAGDHEICEEYPALRRLMDLKAQHVEQHAHPPLLLPLPLLSPGEITTAVGVGTRFDVILLRPLESWQATAELPIRALSADPGFVFLWVGHGDSEGLERGRECFAKWGFRRAEDVVWVKTNHPRTDGVSVEEEITDDEEQKRQKGQSGLLAGGEGLFASSTKEHCLMGIRGTVRRSTDHKFVHCNVDTDVIVYQNDGSEDYAETKLAAFPSYLYTLIENFCLGARRLELFGNPHTARRGWVTATVTADPLPPVAPDSGVQVFDPSTYPSMLPRDDNRPFVPYHPEIDQLRPKSPVRRGQGQGQGARPPQVHGHGHGLPPRPSGLPPPPPRHVQQQQQGMGYMDPIAAQQMQMQMQMQMHAQMLQMQQMQMMAMMGNPMMMQGQGGGQYGYDPSGAGAGAQQGMYGGQGMMYQDTSGPGGQWAMEPNQQQYYQPQQGGSGWGWQQQQ